MKQCEWTGCVNDIRHHIVKDHNKLLLLSHFGENNSKDNLFEALFSNTTYTTFACGHLFWVIFSKVENVLAVKFVCVPYGKIKSSLKITLGFENSKKSLSSSIYVTPENVLDEEETSMSFVLSRVLSLVNVIDIPQPFLNNLKHKSLTVFITVEKD